jgi:hypothetical protein
MSAPTKEQLLAPVAFQAFSNPLLAGVNPRITQFSQPPRIARSSQDRPDDLLSGYSAQITDHVRQLQLNAPKCPKYATHRAVTLPVRTPVGEPSF